ncbi:hypothetical protein METBIDRAFT_61237 [Metschnikowia bicuspidata var. bicuspidata NRRL YB-4993]|uniref:Helicase SWR1 n=1 Tax=Metschnikowia bicuspidata var. bicuspidata NRRL YB-4993 TaxID=869754 RepID=A0A1A0H4Y0_9ASCO|nr:hypothetical protein METBIDRAFT_61237 [Metschnikowia bicuspidata var. bicuspidata NRRL YB-4993]OBA19005.1 hypothetical protein METBIDRAFT_61237 [Metschnikowia bicuspidata var. bicuspidata NRRL YB-4993]
MLAPAGLNGTPAQSGAAALGRRPRASLASRRRPLNAGDEPSSKRAKPEPNGPPQDPRLRPASQEDSLVHVISDFSIAVNELFQLKEYASLVEWAPMDFSRADGSDVPEIFDFFVRANRYLLVWDEHLLENMGDLPLRLQKKRLQEREVMLRKKYPFMDDVLRRSMQRESELLAAQKIPHARLPLPAPRAGKTKPEPRPNGTLSARSARQRPVSRSHPKPQPAETPSPQALGQSDLDVKDEFLDYDFSNIDTNYKLRSVKYSIPPPVVTHPSHIPSWRPLQGDAGLRASGLDSDPILAYHPDPLQVLSTKDWTLHMPQIESKISKFLQTKYKAALIDDGGVEVANTPAEYEATLKQQTHLLKRLYEKVMVEERFELNGDKVERRKIMLPTSSAKHTLDFFRDTGSIVPKIQGAANDQTFHDHLVAQGMAYSKIRQGMRKQHQARTRRIAQIVEQHFRKKAGEKERLAREREQNLKRLSRLAIQSVRKRWSQANRVYRFLQHEKEEELKQIEGREHLSKMLEHSTQLLEAQLNRSSRENTEPDTSNVESNSESSSSTGSDQLSSSDSENDDDGDVAVNKQEKLDSELSVAELRKKYSNMEDSPVTPSDHTHGNEDSDSDSDSANEGDGGLASLYGNNHMVSTDNLTTEYNEDQIKLIKSLSGKTENEVLDSDDFSDSMEEDDMSSSDEGSESENEERADCDDENATHHKTDETDLGNKTSESFEAQPELCTDTSKDHNVDDDENVEEINGFKVKDVPIPSLLRGVLRPYQKQGLNWLASLYNNNTNGILADEMGLGKTIQTISLLSYLACEHHIWGPHLIIVPTSVMLNWEMEFKKFAPGFKVLTYYGSPQERARKRKGWNKQDAFHVCITSYQLVVHDHSSFKRKRWRYMILDEAHNIKNFRSTRWKALLNFNTENRLLLTGTPLQNNLMELWSLLYFLMPSSKVEQMMPEGFANFEDFQQWFGKPVDKILEKTATGDVIDENVTSKLDKETKDTVSRLHQVLRPYLLRRLKKDVEKQMPGKYEHIIYCRLSKRQRYLYDDFMSRAKTKETLASGNFLSIINCLMQLRKVCNHPDLFEVRPIVTSFAMPNTVTRGYNATKDVIAKLLTKDENPTVPLPVINADITNMEDMNYFASEATSRLMSNKELESQIQILDEIIEKGKNGKSESDSQALADIVQVNRLLKLEKQLQLRERLKQSIYLNTLRCQRRPLYGHSLLDFVKKASERPLRCETLDNMILDIPKRQAHMQDTVNKYAVITPTVVALDMKDQIIPIDTQYKVRDAVQQKQIDNPFHQAQVKLSIAFPDKQLLQYDCGKLQKLATLLQDLVPNGHRALIFTQMTKVLDILEQFLNIHGYRYMRLDGATKIEDRQLLTEKFNRDPKIPVFILSTRSGGLGINLTGADTVIFYDSDWNPAMDKQCQDRCHRIGQLRDVHIYRFVSEYTIESNILKKANQKRQLDNVVIQEGDFTTDYLGKFSVRDLVNDTSIISELPDKPIGENTNMELLAQAEDEADRNAAKEAMKEVAVDDEDFTEESKQGTPAPGTVPEDSEVVDDDYEEGVGHIDEYMLRCIADGYYVE